MFLTNEKLRFINRVIDLEQDNAKLVSENRTLKNHLRSVQNDTEFNSRYRTVYRSSS